MELIPPAVQMQSPNHWIHQGSLIYNCGFDSHFLKDNRVEYRFMCWHFLWRRKCLLKPFAYFKIRLSFLLLHRGGLYGLPCLRDGIHLPIQETGVPTLGQEAPWEEGIGNLPSILAWQMPWTENWQATVRGVAKIGHDWLTKWQEVFTDYGEAPYQIRDLQIFSFILWVVFSLNILWPLLILGNSVQFKGYLNRSDSP